MTRLYKILGREDWALARAAGVFTGASVDLADGYIHFSTAGQAQETARLHFAGRPDLVLLTVEAEGLGPALKWEPSRGGRLFPHLFAPLPLDQVTAVREIPLGADGVPDLGVLEP